MPQILKKTPSEILLSRVNTHRESNEKLSYTGNLYWPIGLSQYYMQHYFINMFMGYTVWLTSHRNSLHCGQ